MNTFTNQWNDLKQKYYDEKSANNPDSWYEELRKQFDCLNVKISEIETISAVNTFAYVCPDIEGEMPMVFILRKNNTEANCYMKRIYDAICEYYKFSDFYDEIAGLSCDDLISLCVSEYKIPVVKWYKVGDTEMLNVRKLRSDAY